MARIVNVAIGQLGPIARNETRAQVVQRLGALMREARQMGCDLIVYPELALTTFFPRWYIEDQDEIDAYFEREMPGPETGPLFELARTLGVGFYLGYAELAVEAGQTHRYNTSILVDKTGGIVGKYRKVHLPGHAEHEPWREFQHLEKRYFEPGKDFPVFQAFGGVFGMAICNDRRWTETYREMGVQGVEMILIGYNTPVHNPPAPEHDDLSLFHNELVMQAGAYQNGTWVVGVAKGGIEKAWTRSAAVASSHRRARSSLPARPRATNSRSPAAIWTCATRSRTRHSISTCIANPMRIDAWSSAKDRV